MSGGFTRLGANIWTWQPFVALEPYARILWLHLYTSSPGRSVPGLWTGTIVAMASGAKLPYADTVNALQELSDRGMVEYDQHHEVLRLCMLPDAGEYPANPNMLVSWWNRFLNVVECPVRDRHVQTLRWVLERGARDSAKNRSRKPTSRHEAAWAETFGTVNATTQEPSGLRLVSSDTSTAHQPGLFAPKAAGTVSAAPVEPPPVPVPEFNDHEHLCWLRNQQEKEKEDLDLGSSGSPSGSGSGDPESTPQAKVIPFPKSPDALRLLVAGFPARVNAARQRVADELGITGFRPIALMGGEQTLLERLKESSDPGGDLDHVLAVAEAEALANREMRWLSWSIAEPKAWRVRCAATLSEIRGRPHDRNVFQVAHDAVSRMNWEET